MTTLLWIALGPLYAAFAFVAFLAVVRAGGGRARW